MNDTRSLIESHEFFKQFKPDYVDIITRDAKEVSFGAGNMIFNEGEPANTFYLIESGRIALEAHRPDDGTVSIQTLGAGELLGWSWLVPPFAWQFGARAVEETTVIAMNGAALLVKAEDDPDFGFQLLKAITQIIIHRLQATREILLTTKMSSTLKK